MCTSATLLLAATVLVVLVVDVPDAALAVNSAPMVASVARPIINVFLLSAMFFSFCVVIAFDHARILGERREVNVKHVPELR
ncbi:MAG: hypothetical protein M1157_01605 [Deinococcus sp.]|nr:hypothetical protein [Deinococcus sp.]